MDQVIRPLASLFTGTTDPQQAVRPLHASLYDFLIDEKQSKVFFIDVSLAQNNLAFASLGVMEDDLRFNICYLENSYLPNSAIVDLDKRVKESISTDLSYCCRFWGSHTSATSIELPLAEKVRAFFDGERLLFWVEAVALLKVLSSSVATLQCIAKWLSVCCWTSYFEPIDADELPNHRRVVLNTLTSLMLSGIPCASFELSDQQFHTARHICTSLPCRLFQGGL